MTHDPQDPLPEIRFTYRRLFSFGACAAVFALLWRIVDQLQGDDALGEIAKWLIGLNALVVTYYMIAPSAEQIAKIIQAARVLRCRSENGGN